LTRAREIGDWLNLNKKQTESSQEGLHYKDERQGRVYYNAWRVEI
jgi:hypothetical protein